MTSQDDAAERILRALDSAERGELAALAAAGRMAAERGDAGGWSLAIAAAGAFWGLGVTEPDEAALEDWLGTSAAERLAAARACVYLERLALLRFDGARLERLAALHARLLGADPLPEAQVAADAAAAWADVLAGRPRRDEEEGRALHTRAAKAQAAAIVVEATLQRALAALGAGEDQAALAHARRGSRMSRAEGLVAEEWLAHLLLARVRRCCGRPHLAGHILEALARVAPAPWQGWLCWELVLAAGVEAAAPLVTALRARDAGALDPGARAALALVDLVTAAGRGDRTAFDEARAGLTAALIGFTALAAEAATVAAALDPRLPPTTTLAPWRDGATAAVPLGLQGMPPWPDDPTARTRVDHALGFVAVTPGGRGRRVLRPGVALVEGGAQAERAYCERRAGQRTDVALAVLALAGPEGLAVDVFFREVWGFAFVPRLHQGTLDVAVFNMRKLIEGRAEVVRDKGHIALAVSQPLVLPDPRCARSTAEHVLRLLAHHGVLRAMEATELLGVSARTVQTALKQLAADGACRLERAGRETRYRVLDTTFSVTTGFGGRG